MKVLTLVLKRHWFAMTESGEKRIEYRLMNEHWEKRIWDQRETFTHVRFLKGYTSFGRTYKITNIDIGYCPIPGWMGHFYRIHFEDIPDAAHP